MRCVKHAGHAERTVLEACSRYQYGRLGVLWRNAPRLISDAVVEGRITLATSTVLVDELAEVISRAKFARKIAEQVCRRHHREEGIPCWQRWLVRG